MKIKKSKDNSKRIGLSRLEQETFTHYNQEETTATLSTMQISLINHMERKLGLTPDSENEWGEKSYTFPKAWVRKPQKPPRRKPLTQEQRDAMRERFNKIRK